MIQVKIGDYVRRNHREATAWGGIVEYIAGGAECWVERRPSGVEVIDPVRDFVGKPGRMRYKPVHPDGKVFRLHARVALVNVTTDGCGRPLRKPYRRACAVRFLVRLEVAQERKLS